MQHSSSSNTADAADTAAAHRGVGIEMDERGTMGLNNREQQRLLDLLDREQLDSVLDAYYEKRGNKMWARYKLRAFLFFLTSVAAMVALSLFVAIEYSRFNNELRELRSGEALKAGSVKGDNLSANSVTSSKIASGTILGANMQGDTITDRELGASSVLTSKLGAAAVTTEKIRDGDVTAAKIGAGAVETSRLADLSVTTGKLDDGSVSTSKLSPLGITEATIATAAVTAAKLGENAVTTTKLAASSVTEDKLDEGAVSAGKLGALSVLTDKLGDEVVTAGKIAPATITSDRVADSTLEYGKTAPGLLTDLLFDMIARSTDITHDFNSVISSQSYPQDSSGSAAAAAAGDPWAQIGVDVLGSGFNGYALHGSCPEGTALVYSTYRVIGDDLASRQCAASFLPEFNNINTASRPNRATVFLYDVDGCTGTEDTLLGSNMNLQLRLNCVGS